MKESIFKLAPERVHYDEFWIELTKRNLWLIRLRYGAVFMITSLILGIYLLESIYTNFYINTLPLWIIDLCILGYNIVFHKLWYYLTKRHLWLTNPDKQRSKKGFQSTHFSLIQICIDFAVLLIFIYFTGGVETPLFTFCIFHVVIGSIFLPGIIINMIITAALAISITGSILEYYALIPHHSIQGLLSSPLYNNPTYIIIYFIILGISLYLCVYLANSIAKELYRRERSLTTAYKQLEDAEKSKSRYVMSVVHDLKTPIAAVITYLNMLLDGTLGKLREEHERPIIRSKTRLGNAINTINDILYISQLKLETGIENISEINLVEIFDEIQAEMRVLMASKNIDCTFTYQPNNYIIIKGEAKLLKLAFSNLISNAYKYTGENGQVKVSLTESEDGVRISVADSGIGIPRNEIDKIFQDFYRSSISKQRGIEGTGLGMSIVVEIIRRYRGAVNVESPSYLKMSDEWPGTEFIIDLPKPRV